MVDTSKIHEVIATARRRLRLQSALEFAATAAIPGFGCGLASVYAARVGWVSESTGVLLLVVCASAIVVAALVGALRRFPTHVVATRIDRASGLADRLATACAFEAELGRAPTDAGDDAHHPETVAFMQAAVRDAVRSIPRADVAAATPFRRPRDARAAMWFGVAAILVGGLYFTSDSSASTIVGDGSGKVASAPPIERKDTVLIEEDDLAYTRELLSDLRQIAVAEQEPTLDEFVQSVENLLDQAERGEITKEQLLEELKKAEEKFNQGTDAEEMEKAMSDLKDTGRELKKDELTRELGKALEKGDLEKAQKEFEKLAEKLDKGELSDKQQQKIAKAMDKAADKFFDKQNKQESKADKQIDEAKRQIKKLQRQLDKAETKEQKSKLQRRLERKKRDLKKLEREKKQREKSQQRRTLKRLHRNMEQAAKSMKKKKGENQQQRQQRRRMASRSLKSASRDTGKVDQDRRKVAAQKKVATQLNDLKEALRRARRRGQRGPKDLFGKNRRNQDFNRRARGQKGSRGAWKPGQGQRRLGKGRKPGQKPGAGQGNQPGGKQWGTGTDPNLMGDPTGKSGNIKDEAVSGVHGKGPSRRETILAAAQKGFSSRSYKSVYARYKTIVEEVIRAEKVPSGYKYYVKKYFQKIKPHAM